MTEIMHRTVLSYQVTSKLGGSVEVIVQISSIKKFGERRAIGDAAWFQLEQSSARNMLKSMCCRYGYNNVKQVFINKITFETQWRE